MTSDNTQTSDQERLVFTRRYQDVQAEVRRVARAIRRRHVAANSGRITMDYLRDGNQTRRAQAMTRLNEEVGFLTVIFLFVVFCAAPVLLVCFALAIVSAASAKN